MDEMAVFLNLLTQDDDFRKADLSQNEEQQNVMLTAVGFEPTPPQRLVP